MMVTMLNIYIYIYIYIYYLLQINIFTGYDYKKYNNTQIFVWLICLYVFFYFVTK